MDRIKMINPVVEMDGDEMTRILWQDIKDQLILPFVDLKSLYFDLGLPERDRTDDQVTYDAAEAIKKYGVGVKCATITANTQRKEEYNLKQLLPSPNATLRAALDGTVFRAPIVVNGIDPSVSCWKRPIVIARHAYGDVYTAVEHRVEGPGLAELVFTAEDGTETRKPIFRFEGPGILQAMHNHDASIYSFARACFQYALSEKLELWFATKDTISKIYDHRFKDIFNEVYENEFKEQFEAAGITYFYTLIDDALARIIRSEGGFLLATKNYDGDILSDLISRAFGSLAMMTSVLVSPDGKYEYEAAHGTVTKHYYRYLKGEKTSSNPVATIYAWTGGLRKRGEMDNLPDLVKFADDMEAAVIRTITSGIMTGDIAALYDGEATQVTSTEFLAAIRKSYEDNL